MFSPNGISENCAEVVASNIAVAYGKPMNKLPSDIKEIFVRELT